MDFRTRRIITSDGDTRMVLAPGSTLKPLALSALIDNGTVPLETSVVCPQGLTIGGRSFGCVHPALSAPVTFRSAIAYSCNNFVARVAQRLAPGQLARELIHRGVSPDRVRRAATVEQRQMQALGVWGVLVTPQEVLFAYHSLAGRCHRAILEGLEQAVEYGTAQAARVSGLTVAGKTGTAPGNAAWFAGFAPSRAPRYVVVVLTGGRSGGADAAPLAARMLSEALR